MYIQVKIHDIKKMKSTSSLILSTSFNVVVLMTAFSVCNISFSLSIIWESPPIPRIPAWSNGYMIRIVFSAEITKALGSSLTLLSSLKLNQLLGWIYKVGGAYIVNHNWQIITDRLGFIVRIISSSTITLILYRDLYNQFHFGN